LQEISRGQIESTIQLLKAKVAMREKYLHYTEERNLWERNLVEEAAPAMGLSKTTMERYLCAHKRQGEAMKEIELVVIAELKSQVAIHEAMLSEGDRTLVIPSSKSHLT